MSNSGNSGNNKLPPPPSPLSDENTLTQHAEFYYEDGSTVFQAGNFLFRFQASLLRADSGVEGYKFEPIMNRRLRSFSIFNEDPGSSDCNPIILPLEAIDFEALVSVVLGRDKHPIVSSSFVAPLLGRALNKPNIFTFHVVVGIVASYFGMKSLEAWALSRARAALESAKLAAREWPENYLRRLLEYLQTNDIPELQHEILGFMQLVLSLAAISSSNISAEGSSREATILCRTISKYNASNFKPYTFWFCLCGPSISGPSFFLLD